MYIVIVAVVVIIDQIIKVFVRSNLYLSETHPIIEGFFSFTYIENYGAAFSMLSGQRIILIGLPLLIIVAGFIYIIRGKRGNNKVALVAASLLVGGGIGNFIDRLFLGSVTDYLDLNNFAIFNFADICVCLGCALICIYVVFIEGKGSIEK
ncbi:MAG: signal peptidase II [Anaerovoracaceae bacterium]